MNKALNSRFYVPKSNLLAYSLTTFILIAYFFYLDEGNFNFEWAAHPVSWIIFSIYFVVFLVLLLLIDAFTFRKLVGAVKAAISILLFLSASFMISYILFYNPL